MNIVVDGTFQFEDGKIVLEGGRIVLPVHNDPLDVLGHGSFRFQVARDVKLSKHGYQRGQEAVIK